MASDAPNPGKKQPKNHETSKFVGKRNNDSDMLKEEKKTAKNKKAKLSIINGNSKQRDQHGFDKEAETTEEDAKMNVFPMNRIRTMIKGEDPNMRVSQEALFAINNATEKFLQHFAHDAYATCVQDHKKSLIYDHLANVITKQRRYDFLSDFVPQRVRVEDALRERSQASNGGV